MPQALKHYRPSPNPIPINIDWRRLVCAFGEAGLKNDALINYEVSKELLYYLRKGKSQPNPTWSTCKKLWLAAQARLTPEEIEGCIREPD